MIKFDRKVRGDLPSPSRMFSLKGQIVGPEVRVGSPARIVWAGFGSDGWYALPRDAWPSDLREFGDLALRTTEERFLRPLEYRHGATIV